MKPSFEKTVDILVKAYLNDTLRHQDCSACAVGNILGTGAWAVLFVTPAWENELLEQLIAPAGHVIGRNFFGHELVKIEDHYDEATAAIAKANKAIEKSGYSIPELARIENAFEIAPHGSSDDEWMFNGLMAVVDVLADIHGIDLETKESAKLLFQKA